MFTRLKLDNVLVTHRNVIKDGFNLPEIKPESIDAVFLDLPNPELAVTHLLPLLKKSAKLCSFSPCIEQINKTAKILA